MFKLALEVFLIIFIVFILCEFVFKRTDIRQAIKKVSQRMIETLFIILLVIIIMIIQYKIFN